MGRQILQLLDDIHTKECRAFAHAWQAWRGGNLLPKRSDVRIEDIARQLHLVSVVEVVSPEAAIFRLAGTALCNAMGIELTGLNYFDFATPEERGPRIARTLKVVEQPCGSHFVFPIAYSSGRTVRSEVLSFPVQPDDPSAPPQVFGIATALEETTLDRPIAEPNILPLPEGYQFVDIGAGVPGTDSNLADRPPASLLLKQAS